MVNAVRQNHRTLSFRIGVSIFSAPPAHIRVGLYAQPATGLGAPTAHKINYFSRHNSPSRFSSASTRRKVVLVTSHILTVSTQNAVKLIAQGVVDFAGAVQVEHLFENIATGNARRDQDQIIRRTHGP